MLTTCLPVGGRQGDVVTVTYLYTVCYMCSVIEEPSDWRSEIRQTTPVLTESWGTREGCSRPFGGDVRAGVRPSMGLPGHEDSSPLCYLLPYTRCLVCLRSSVWHRKPLKQCHVHICSSWNVAKSCSVNWCDHSCRQQVYGKKLMSRCRPLTAAGISSAYDNASTMLDCRSGDRWHRRRPVSFLRVSQ